MKKLLILSLSIILLTGFLFAVGEREVLAEEAAIDVDTVIYAQHVSLTDIDPAYGAYLQYPAGYEAAYSIYDGLVTFDADLNIKPSLAASWEVSADSTTWTFKLREGISFHDGTPFNAEAVKVNFERGMDPDRTTTNRPLWDPWKAVEVVDNYTVRMTTDKPFATALNALAHGAGLMVSPAAIKEYDDHLEHHPVGTGPYKLKNFNVGSELTLVANQSYFGGEPKVQNLIYRHIPEASTRVAALLAGEVHVINAVPPQQALRLANEQGVKVVSIPGLRPYQVNLNLTREVFQDKRVRQALNYAVSKQAISKGIFLDYAKPADSPLAFNTTGHATAGSYTYDPKKAGELLSQAGWKDTNDNGILDQNGQEFEVTVITPDGWLSQDLTIIQAVARQLETVGVKVIINKVEPASFWGPITAPTDDVEWDMAFFGFNPSNAAGVYHLESLYLSNSDPKGGPRAWNMMRYENSEVDDLLSKAKQTVNSEDRFKLLADAQKIIWDDAPAIWLVVPEVISARRTGLKGVEVWPITFTILRGVGE